MVIIILLFIAEPTRPEVVVKEVQENLAEGEQRLLNLMDDLLRTKNMIIEDERGGGS